ncbi:hypothetical protein [Salininema proteolyticum]|uniref:Phage tail protein n=1 Tax=Salininema proteolyticum TaxID=1607685 RepID=A0ABV8TTN6_9ACTN
MGELLSKDAILKADDIELADIDVPEWGGTVRLRGLDGMQRARINGTAIAVRGQTVSIKADALAEQQLRIVCACLVDADGKQLFTVKEFEKLGRKSAEVIERLYQKASELSGLGGEAVDDTAKNSESTPSDSS